MLDPQLFGRFERPAQFGKTAGAQLRRTLAPGSILENRHRQDAHAFEILRGGEIQLPAQVGAAVGTHRVEAAVDIDAAGMQRPVGVGIAGKAAGTKGADALDAHLRHQVEAQADQLDLLVEGVEGKVLALFYGARKRNGPQLVRPFGVQVKLNVMAAGTDQVDDDGQFVDPEARGKQRLDKKNALEPVALEDFERLGQRVVALLRAAINVTLETRRKLPVEILPAVAPDLDVEAQIDVHRLRHGLPAWRSSSTRLATPE